MNRKTVGFNIAIVICVAGLFFIILFGFLIPAASAQVRRASSVRLTDWTQINTDGFGSSQNGSVNSLAVFNDQLYAGVSNYDLGAGIWRLDGTNNWTQVNLPGFGPTYNKTNAIIFDMTEFKGQFYAGTGQWDNVTIGQIWRSSDGSIWNLVEGAGFGNGNNGGILNFAVFKDSLYAATSNFNGTEIWRSATGNSGSWTKANVSGFTDGTNHFNCTGLIVFNNELFAAVEVNTSASVGAQIWHTLNGTNWTQANLNGFGDVHNYQTGGWAEFNGYLYMGTRNDVTGAQLWRSSNGTSWSAVVSDGFGDINNFKLEGLIPYENSLIAVTDNSVTGLEVQRSIDGTHWNQINVDGFGDINNFGTLWSNSLAIFQGQLYLGTDNASTGGEVWMYDKSIYLPLVIKSGPTWTPTVTFTPSVTPSDGPIHGGSWSGNTELGSEYYIRFIVNLETNKVDFGHLDVNYGGQCNRWSLEGMDYITLHFSITDNHFGSTFGDLTLEGTFNSSSSASGTYKVGGHVTLTTGNPPVPYVCYYSHSGTWNAYGP